MDRQAVLKAAGVGAAVLTVLNVLGLIPCVGCLTFLLNFVAYVGIGILAAYWMTLPRTTGSGATNGAIATLAAALVAGFIGLLIQSAYFSITGVSPIAQAFESLPPEQLEAMAEAGLDPAMFTGSGGLATFFVAGSLCCSLWAVLAAALGAAGGAFWGGRRSI
jgi:hypothetical protein